MTPQNRRRIVRPVTLFQLFINVLQSQSPSHSCVVLRRDNAPQSDVLEIFMELVILSTVAAIAILLAELRDFAAGEQFGRSMTLAGAPRSDSNAPPASGSGAANSEAPARRRELERAA